MVKLLDENLFRSLTEKAKNSPRKRTHHNLHESLDEPFHRLCIAAEPGTYMRPHRHEDKWELMTILKGAMALLIFDDSGNVLERIELNSSGTIKACELPAGAWHSFTVMEEGTIMLEVKRGPYHPPAPSEIAGWASAEGEDGWERFQIWYENAKPGDAPPA